MRVYCDTSFLVSLLVEPDVNHPAARKVAAKFTEPVPYTLWCELEFTHSLRRAAVLRQISLSEHDAVLRQIADDEAAGLLLRPVLNHALNHAKARELSKRHTAAMPSLRSADIFHVASALLLGSDAFASFDRRQRELAGSEGLKVLPAGWE
jgi:predicted nucleic acid-binding protein